MKPKSAARARSRRVETALLTDVNNDTIPGATVVLEGPAPNLRTVVTNDNGFFEFNNVEPGTTYHVNVSAQGFANWTSPGIILGCHRQCLLSAVGPRGREGIPECPYQQRRASACQLRTGVHPGQNTSKGKDKN